MKLPESNAARFNEYLESCTNASKKERDSKNQTILSIKNLAAFTKERTALKVIGTPNLNATKTNTESALSRISKNTRSVFSKSKRY